MKNTTGKHLLQGPVTVLDAGSYAGDARIDDLPPGQQRLISYGVDQQVLVNSSLNKTDGDEVSAESVKDRIRAIVLAEDARHPLSDQHIAEILAKENVDIARRTVAKYREIMGILPSSKRRQVY